MGWSIADKVDNVFEDGQYIFKIESIKYNTPKEDREHGRMTMRLKVVGDGAHANEAILQGFPLDPEFLGILASFLQGTGEFDAKEQFPDDEEQFVEIIKGKLEGKEYVCDYEVQESKKSGRRFGQVTVIEPYSANFQ